MRDMSEPDILSNNTPIQTVLVPLYVWEHFSFMCVSRLLLWTTVSRQEITAHKRTGVNTMPSIYLPAVEGGVGGIVPGMQGGVVNGAVEGIVLSTEVRIVSGYVTIVVYWFVYWCVTQCPITTRFSTSHLISLLKSQAYDREGEDDDYEQLHGIWPILFLPDRHFVMARIRRGSHYFPCGRLLASVLRRATLYFVPATSRGKSYGCADSAYRLRILYFRNLLL